MSRKIAALAGFAILVALALTLLWRVYVHHTRQDPDATSVIEVVSSEPLGEYPAPVEWIRIPRSADPRPGT